MQIGWYEIDLCENICNQQLMIYSIFPFFFSISEEIEKKSDSDFLRWVVSNHWLLVLWLVLNCFGDELKTIRSGTNLIHICIGWFCWVHFLWASFMQINIYFNKRKHSESFVNRQMKHRVKYLSVRKRVSGHLLNVLRQQPTITEDEIRLMLLCMLCDAQYRYFY